MDLWSGRIDVVVCPFLTSQPRLQFPFKKYRNALTVLEQFRKSEKSCYLNIYNYLLFC